MSATPALATLAPPTPVLVETQPRKYDLAQLRQAPFEQRNFTGPRLGSFPFALPAGVKQGDPAWYVLHLSYKISFPAKASGEWEITADINGYTAISVEVERQLEKTTIDTVSLIGGRTQQQTSESSFRDTVQNYAQDSSLLAGGRNTLNFAITPRGEVSGKPSLTLFEESGLEVTTVAPDEVILGVPRRTVSISTGRTADVPFTVRRRGGRPDQPVTVSIQASEGLEVVGPTRYDFDGVGSERTGSFAVKGVTDGQYRVRISVSSKFNTAGNLIPIEVGPKRSQSLDRGTVGVVATLLGCSALFYFLSRRRRAR